LPLYLLLWFIHDQETGHTHPVSITGLQVGSVDIDRTADRQVTVVSRFKPGPLDPGDTVNYSAKLKIITALLVFTLPVTIDTAWPADPSGQTDGATVTSVVNPLDKYRGAKELSETDLVDLLKLVGFTGKSLKVAWATVMKESRGHPLSHNNNVKTGDNSYGLFQINMFGDLGSIRRDKFNLKSNDELLDPVTNAQAAFYMTAHGTDFGSWGYGPNAYDGTSAEPEITNWIAKFPN